MTVAQIFSISRFLTNTNSVTAPDTNLLRLLSERNKQMVIQLSKLKEDYLVERSTTDLVSGQEEYPLPTDCIRVKRLEVLYASDGTWTPVSFYDINESNNANDTSTIGQMYTKEAPLADVFDSSLFLRPIPDANVTAGLKLWFVQRPADVTATTDVPDSPIEHHRTLADLLAIDIRQLKGDVTPAQALQLEEALWAAIRNRVSPRVTDESMLVKPSAENYD